MKTGSWFLFFFLVSVAAIVLNERPIDAGRVLKRRSVVAAQADKIPCDYHIVPNGDYDVRDILMNKLSSGPSGGVGHKYSNNFGPAKMKTSDAANTLKINKLPSGPSGGVGHKYINAEGFTKPSVVPSQKVITMMPFNKLPSGPSGGVGHNNND